jgi:hypothetical protein
VGSGALLRRRMCHAFAVLRVVCYATTVFLGLGGTVKVNH